MKRNSKCAPDLALLDLTNMNALSEVIRLKPHTSVLKNQRNQIVLALKAYTREKVMNKQVEIALELDKFGEEADNDTSKLTPQVIRERIADIIIKAAKPKSTYKSKTKTKQSPSKVCNKVSPSPSKKPKKIVVHDFPNKKKQLNDETDTKR